MDHNTQASYLHALLPWLDRLRDAVASWQQRWSPAAGQSPPVLRFVGGEGSGAILDTRSGSPVRIDAGPEGRRILDALAAARDLEQLARHLERHCDGSLEREIERLIEFGLLFREESRMLSLVLPATVGPAAVEPRLERLDRSRYRARRGDLRDNGERIR
jgi:hypothetical protein